MDAAADPPWTAAFDPLRLSRNITVEASRADTIDRPKLQVLLGRHGADPRDRQSPDAWSRQRAGRHRPPTHTPGGADGAGHGAGAGLHALPPCEHGPRRRSARRHAGGLPPDAGSLPDLRRGQHITVHTLSLKKGSRILLEGLPIPTAEDVAAMLDYADPALRARGFAPYYLYRQKYMSGSFENVGWCISGAEGLYNIYIMEELHSILSLGAGGSTKMVDAGRNRIERVFHPKFPLEYIQRPEKLTENLEAFRRFHENMAR